MKRDLWIKYRYPAVVGLFTFAGITILLVFIFTLGAQHGSFIRSMEIIAEFEDVGGLKKGDNVWYYGVRVGAIKEIAIMGRDKVRVRMSVEQGLDSLIRSDARVRMGSDGLMGNRIIVIFGGTADAPAITSGIILRSVRAPDTRKLLEDAVEGGKDLNVILKNLRSITAAISEGEGALGMMISDSTLAADLSASGSGLRNAVSEARRLAMVGRSAGVRLDRLLAKAGEEGYLLDELLTDTLGYPAIMASLQDVQAATGHLRHVSGRLDSLLVDKGSEGSVASMILNDPVSGRRLAAILANLDSASRKLDEDLLAARESFLLRRYFRKKRSR